MKKWRTHKILSWVANTKGYSLLHILVVIEKRETEYEKLANCYVDRNKPSWEEKELTETLIISISFSDVVLARPSSGFSVHKFAIGVSPFPRAHPKMGTEIFSQSSYRHVSSLTLSFPLFCPASTSMVPPLELLSANNSQWQICCWYIPTFILGVRFREPLSLARKQLTNKIIFLGP